MLGLSVDPVESHLKWIKDVEEFGCLQTELPYPLLADVDGTVATMFGMLDAPLKAGPEGKAPMPPTVRAVYLIDPSKKLRCMCIYPAQVGRNTNELLRVLKALQNVDNKSVVAPVNWSLPEHGSRVIIPPFVSDEAAAAKYPVVEKTKYPYLRYTTLE